MAKGGSLIGRADATIVNAAYRAALGNVPVDNSAALTTMRNTYKSMLDKSGEIFKQIETDKIAMDQDIQSMISPLLDELEDGTLTDPAFEDTKNKMQAFSTEAENILKSREYRRGDKSAMLDFNRRFNTYVNGIQSEKQQLEALATNLEGQAYNVTATKGQELQKGILKFYRGDEDSGVTRTFKGNKAYYTMNIGGEEVTKSLKDIADGIIPKDVKTRGGFDTNLQVVGRSAAKGQKFDAIGAKKTAETLLESSPDKIKTLQDFFHTEHRGQTGTLAQGLSTGQGGFGKISADLFTVLNKNGLLQEYDTEKTPGKITKEDFEGKNAAKYMQLVDDITSGKNYDLSKKIASELYADVVAKDEHDRLRFVAGSTEGTGTGFLTTKKGINSGTLGYYVFPTYDDAKFEYDQFDLASQGKKAKFSIGKAQYVFDVEGDNAYKWVEKTAGGGQKVKGTTTELIGPDGFGIKDSDFLKLTDFEGGNTKEIKEFEGLGTGSANNKNLHKTLFNKLDLNDDDDVSKNLNDYFGLGRRSKLNFMPFALASEKSLSNKGGAGGTGFGKADTAYTNDIMLYNPQTGEVIKDEDGNRMRFKIGDDIKSLDENTGLSEDVAKILEILNQYDIKTPKQKGETSVTKAEVDNMIQKYLPKQN